MKWLLVSIILILTLNGCSDPEPRTDLKNYVETIKKLPAGVIEPLPHIKPYEGVVYESKLLRNPFSVPVPKNLANATSDDGLSPDMHRRKEVLEFYSLDSLKMLGTIEKDQKKWAVVVDPDKTVHRITVGNYLGMHHGKVVKLLDNKIEVLELVVDPNGKWSEKKATLVLIE